MSQSVVTTAALYNNMGRPSCLRDPGCRHYALRAALQLKLLALTPEPEPAAAAGEFHSTVAVGLSADIHTRRISDGMYPDHCQTD